MSVCVYGWRARGKRGKICGKFVLQPTTAVPLVFFVLLIFRYMTVHYPQLTNSRGFLWYRLREVQHLSKTAMKFPLTGIEHEV